MLNEFESQEKFPPIDKPTAQERRQTFCTYLLLTCFGILFSGAVVALIIMVVLKIRYIFFN